MNADEILDKVLTTSKSRYLILGISALYLVLNAIVTIVFRDRLYSDISIIPGGYRVLMGGFILSVIMIGSITAFIRAARIPIHFLKVLYIYILPVFLYFVAGFAYGFQPRFLLDVPSFTMIYLQINITVLCFLPVWVSYVFGENRRQFKNLRRNLKGFVRELSEDIK